MNCYRLAKYYGRHPDEFLSKPMSAIARYSHWTEKLLDASRPKEEDESG